MILCTDPILKEILKKQGVKALVFDTVLSADERQKMLESLHEFASGWFLDEQGKDFTEYCDVSIGAAVHDEVMILFHMLYHFVKISEKIKADEIFELYQSDSCRVPKAVEGLITDLGGKVKTTSDVYPYLCFRKFHDFQARNNYTYNNLKLDDENEEKNNILNLFKLWVKIFVSRLGALSSGKKEYLYIQIMRSLVPFYDDYFLQQPLPGLILSHNSKLFPSADYDHVTSGRLEMLWRVLKLGTRGIRIDSLKKISFFENQRGYYDFKAVKNIEDLFKKNFPRAVKEAMKNTESKATNFFLAYFETFFFKMLPKFVRTIDYYYAKFQDKKIIACLQEVLHPLQLQVLANLRKRSFIIAPNFILHNQYFMPYLLSRTNGMFKAFAVSEYDRSRYKRLGFKEENVVIIDPGFFRDYRAKLKPMKTLQTFRESVILIIPPFIPWLHTFRHQYSGNEMLNYFSDIFNILEDLNVAEVRIRPHPGVNKVKANRCGYTYKDCYEYFLKTATDKHGSYSFKISFSESYYHNLEGDIENCDLVIGAISGVIFSALLGGRDYIVFDNSVAPYPGRLEASIIHDGIIRRLRTKDELRNFLDDYTPVNRDEILLKYYDNIFSTPIRECSFDEIILKQVGVFSKERMKYEKERINCR